jgi:Fe-S-cluster containining protein
MGTCCHGNSVFLNPWELATIAKEKGITPTNFLEQYLTQGGIQLKFDGKQDGRGLAACSQYVQGFGCGVHTGRPLACRLFPLGRQIQNGEVRYIYEGVEFPCLNGCAEVLHLPKLDVETYLKEQATSAFEQAQDAYLEVMQNLADIAFSLLLDTGLTESKEFKTLDAWRKLGNLNPEELSKSIGEEWKMRLLVPNISATLDVLEFIHLHEEQLLDAAQNQINTLQNDEDWHKASVLMMALSLFLSHALGADSKGLSEHWIQIAKSHGAKR